MEFHSSRSPVAVFPSPYFSDSVRHLQQAHFKAFAYVLICNTLFFTSVLQPSVRKTHNSGRKHRDNVRAYYEKWVEKNIPGGMVT